MNGLLVTGDFMKLTGVTRNTLIHYDNMGLLKPVRSNKRGDRFYHPFQWYTIIFIKTFQTAGISLESIKMYLEESRMARSGDKFLTSVPGLIQVQRKMSTGYRELLKSYRYLDKMVYITGLFNKYVPGEAPKIRKLEVDGWLKEKHLDKEVTLRSPEYYAECNRVVYEQYDALRDGSFPVVTHFREKEFIKGRNMVYAISSYSLIGGDKPVSDFDMTDCIVMRRVGDISDLIRTFDLIRDYMNERCYEPADRISVMTNIFAFDQLGNRQGDRIIIVPVRKVEIGCFKRLQKSDFSEIDSHRDSENAPSHLLKSGEFIKLCGITRNALNHYEKHGLLAPEYIADNGYKYYGISQMSALINIKCLKQAGFSIEQIKNTGQGAFWESDYLSRRIEMLQNQKEVIRQKIQELVDAKIYLSELTNGFMKLEPEFTGRGHMCYLDRRRYFRRIPFEAKEYDRNIGFQNEVMKAIKAGKESQELFDFPIGMSINEKCEYQSIASVNMVMPKHAGKDDIVMEGQYIAYMIVCGSSYFAEEIKEITEDAKKQGFDIRGDIISLFMIVKKGAGNEVQMQSVTLVPVR